MDKKRWSLILMALCIALAFSVSSVEAQKDCDADDDFWVKDTGKCRKLIDEVVFLGIDCNDNLPSPTNTDCGDPEPEPTTGTPVIVTFADFTLDESGNPSPDSIQSDHDDIYPTPRPYEHDGEKRGIAAVLDGAFVMILRAGGERKLFIDFGDIVDCDSPSGTPTPAGDCVKDVRFGSDPQNNPLLGIVECPFPRFDTDGKPPFRTTDGSCSALVQAALEEHDVFAGVPNPEEIIHVEDMELGVIPCVGDDPPFCSPVIKVRPFQEYDVFFNMPRLKGNGVDGWIIAFSAKQEKCRDGAPASFPEYLSIRAVGDEMGADTWHIGTFDENGRDDPRIACLLTADGGAGQSDDVVGFFPMSFMYTITICEGCPSP